MNTQMLAPRGAATEGRLSVPAGEDAPRRKFLSATGITAGAAVVANLAIWALTTSLVDVPDRFTPLQPGSVAFLTIVGVLLAAGFLRLLAGRSERPAQTFRRLVPVALVVSLIPDALIWADGAYGGTAEAQTVLPLMAMHVVAAAASWLLLPTGLNRPVEPRS